MRRALPLLVFALAGCAGGEAATTEPSCDPTCDGAALPAEAFWAPGPDPVSCAATLVPLGTVATEIRGLFLRGDLLYVGDDYGGFRILDVSDPTRPVQRSALTLLTGVSRGVHVEGDLAYLTAADAGILVIDVKDPAAPRLATTLDLPGYTRHTWIAGNRAYVADDWEGFHVVDLTDPRAPVPLGRVRDARPGYRIAVAAEPTVVYQASGHAGVIVLDVADPANPVELRRVDTPGHAWDLVVRGDSAWVADDTHGIVTLALDDPRSPTVVSTVDTSGHARSVFAVGDRLYAANGSAGLPQVDPDPGGYLGIADGHDGLLAFDLSNPRLPSAVGTADVDGYGLVVTADERVVVVGANGAGLRLFAAEDLAPRAAFSQLPGTARGLAVAGSPAQVFVAAGHAGLRVIDTRDPKIPFEIAHVDLPGTALDVAVIPHRVFVASGEAGVSVVDVPRFEAPRLVTTLVTGEARAVVTSGGVVAAATPTGLVRFRLQDLAPLGLAPGDATAVAAWNDGVVAVGEAGLRVVDEAGQVTLDGVDAPAGPDLDVRGDWVAIAGLESGVALMDLGASGARLGQVKPKGPVRGVAFAGDRLIVVVGDESHVHSAIHVVDITHPSAPVFESTSDLIEPGQRVVVSGSRAYVTASDGGLRLAELGCAALSTPPGGDAR